MTRCCLTQRAVETIRAHGGGGQGTFIYLAYQNVHSTAQSAANGLMGTHPIQAPAAVGERAAILPARSLHPC